jgi:hypothetical protein
VEATNFTIPVPFPTIPVGGRFVSVFTICNDVATRIKPNFHNGKLVNAERPNGKLIFVADWEPVFVEEYEDQHFYALYWECPECDIPNHAD